MANHDLVLGQSSDLALGHDRGDLVIEQVHGLGLAHRQTLGINHAHLRDFGLGLSGNPDLEFGHHHDGQLILALDHLHDHDPHGRANELALGHSTQSHDMDLSENHELAFDETHELSTDQDHEFALQPNDEMSQLQLVSPRVVQARALIASPEHQLAVGQEFSDVKSCRRAIRDAAIACRFEIQTVKSDKTRFTAKCAAEGCPWRIHAAKLPGVPTFTIRTIHDIHSCAGINHLGHHQASVQWVANSVEERIRENPHCKPKEILEEIHRTHGITLSYKQAWRGKEMIMAAVRGSFEEGYRLLPQYCEQVKGTNPGSIANVYGNPDDNCFRRLFVSFYASIYGFVNACRPLIGLDRTILKSKYLGTLLFATGFDGDGALFPLAFGVVDEESDENWIWFLSELHALLEANTENMPRLTILSDRQRGIVDGVEFNFPTAFHGFCMRNLSESFRKEFNNPILVDLFWEAAQALTIMEFEAKMLEIEEITSDAAFWIRRIPSHLWATAYFEGERFGHLSANIAESLSSWLVESTGLPIYQMMESIRRHLMMWFNERREASMQWVSALVPSAERRMSEYIERARGYQVGRANEAEFEVVSPHEGVNIVDIRNRRCLCRGWQLCGLPCAHGVAALLSCRQNVHRYTESYFTVATYRKTYSQTIHPIPDRSLWNESSETCQDGESKIEIVINPPKSVRPAGKPRKRRVRAEESGGKKRAVHCSRCNQTGHFRTTCAAPI
ncbi:uncharacterized protein LOC109713152 [Ananas comosus]|uniref:Uncharacterized protein LOC109713152 n=1 Tax=Ananas comosus TaxID=4615 RepID=A0A6P5FHK8_ANACO|nr:uncharacterized protein LOC109713152 [Ananas comosus]XP_020092717.1 uncharacterized protein LOC109713152 [Ananas comosus]